MPPATEKTEGSRLINCNSKLNSPGEIKLSFLMKQLSNPDPVKRAKAIKKLFGVLRENKIPKKIEEIVLKQIYYTLKMRYSPDSFVDAKTSPFDLLFLEKLVLVELASRLPGSSGERIKSLLEKRALPCSCPIDLSQPQNCHEAVAFALAETITRSSNKTQREIENGFGTSLWNVLAINKYHKSFRFSPLRIQGKIVTGINKWAMDQGLNKLKPGDALLFESVTGTEHSAIYLGKSNGVNYMFQKRGVGCGEEFPFEIISLDLYLENMVINGVGWRPGEGLSTDVEVWRK